MVAAAEDAGGVVAAAEEAGAVVAAADEAAGSEEVGAGEADVGAGEAEEAGAEEGAMVRSAVTMRRAAWRSREKMEGER